MNTPTRAIKMTTGVKRIHAMVRGKKANQSGFTLIELIVVSAIVMILGIAGLIGIRGYIVNGRIEPGSHELRRAMQRMSINAEGQGATPFASASTAQFCNLLRDGSVIAVTGTGATATCAHSLTYSGTKAITVAPATTTTLGDAYSITLTSTSEYACPDLLSIMQKASLTMSVNGTSVLSLGGTYNAAAATAACTSGDTNTFVFTAS